MDMDFKYSKIRDNFIEWFGLLIIVTGIIYITYHRLDYLYMLFCYGYGNIFLSVLLIYVCYRIFVFLIIIYENIEQHKRIINLTCNLILVVCILYLSGQYITENYFNGSSFQSINFSEYFFSIYRVYSGQTQIIDFNNIYGFYGDFYTYFLKIMGSASMHNVSIIAAALMLIILGSVVIVIYKMCENKILALLGGAVFSFCISVFSSSGVSGEYDLSFSPHKLLFPMLIILVSYFMITNRYKKYNWVFVLLGYTISILSLLWNTDSGIIVIISYMFLRLYLLLTYNSYFDKKFWKGIAKLTGEGLLGFAIAISLLIHFTYLKSGIVLDYEAVSEVFFKQFRNSAKGYRTFSMTLVHPWIMLVFIYALSISKALRNLKLLRINNEIKHVLRLSMYWLLSVMGLGFFSYYQEYSNSANFVRISWPAVILIILFADDYIKRTDFSIFRIKKLKKGFRTFIRRESLKTDAIKIVKLCMAVLFLSAIAVRFLGAATFLNEFDKFKIGRQPVENSQIFYSAEIIKKCLNDGENVNIIAEYSTVLYMLIDEPVPKGLPDTVMMTSKDRFEAVINYLKSSEYKIVFDEKCLYLLKLYMGGSFDSVIQSYELYDYRDGFYIYEHK